MLRPIRRDVTLLDHDLPSLQTSAAAAEARHNYKSNLAALAAHQPWVATYARDGFLTAYDPAGHWWGDCSLPKRAGLAMLKQLDLRGVVGCFLAPTHAGQIAAALEKIEQHQAILVIQPDDQEMAFSLACCDFSGEIERHRLWFATGANWAQMIAALFEARRGLPTPGQFIRISATSDDLVNQLIPEAEKAFSDVNTARGKMLDGISSTTRTKPSRRIVVAPSHFRLWDDAGAALAGALAADDVIHLDPDDPAQASAHYRGKSVPRGSPGGRTVFYSGDLMDHAPPDSRLRSKARARRAAARR